MPVLYFSPRGMRRARWMVGAILVLYAVVIIAVVMAIVRPACAGELLVPLFSHHTAYQGKKIDGLNEQNFGLGYERDDHYFGVVFKDSLSNTSGMLGRNFRWQSELGSGWHVSGTLAAGLMFRKNVRDYAPFPVVVPFVGIGKDSWTAEFTYIPATKFTEQGAAFLMLRKTL